MGPIEWQQGGWLWAAGAALLGGTVAAVLIGRRAGRRQAVGWLLRGMLVAAVLAAIARPTWTEPAGRGRLVVLVDRSASMPPGWAQEIVSQLPRRLGETELIGFSFAGQADRLDLARGPLPGPAGPGDGSDPGPAMRMAVADLADRTRPAALLLLTDGNWTGSPDWPAGPVWALCPSAGQANAGLTGLTCARVTDGAGAEQARLAVRATLSASRDGTATVALSVGDAAGPAWQPVADSQRDVPLSAGQLRTEDWLLDPPAGRPGGWAGALVRAEVTAQWDRLDGDNRLTAWVSPPPGQRTCLLITAQPSGPTRRALEQLPGWSIGPGQVLTAEQARAGGPLAAANPPAVVVLDDVPASAMAEPFVTELKRHVESGGGLLVVGGPNALAAGGYYDSPVEALLAVHSRPRQRPPAAIVLLLDRSGSMNEPPSVAAATAPGSAGAERLAKLDLVKQAVLGLPDLFVAGDRLAVIGFADQARPAYQTETDQPVDWQAVRKALLEMPASGGTAIEPALRAAADWLARQPLARKHLLLLTDGLFSDLTLDQASAILRTAVADSAPPARLTVSTFAAIEQGENRFLADLAKAFDGAHHPPGNWATLRTRFRDDLAGATFPPTLAGPFQVEPVAGRPALPPVSRLLTCQLRPQASLWYEARPANGADASGDRRWPLVAVAPLGAGRTGVVATSLSAGWADAWQPQAAMLLGALLDELAGSDDDPRLTLQVGPADPGGQRSAGRERPAAQAVALDVFARQVADGRPINRLDLRAVLVDSSGRQQALDLPQVAPGHYHAVVPAERLGEPTRVLIVQRSDGAERTVLRRSLGPALPAEFARLRPDPTGLDAFCRRHGGRLLESLDQLGDVKARLTGPGRHWTLWPGLLLAAVVLWLADLWLRRPGQTKPPG